MGGGGEVGDQNKRFEFQRIWDDDISFPEGSLKSFVNHLMIVASKICRVLPTSFPVLSRMLPTELIIIVSKKTNKSRSIVYSTLILNNLG